MAQASGMMNSAPPPIPGGYGNATGANFGLPNVNMKGLPPSVGGIPTAASATSNLPVSLQSPAGTQSPTSSFTANSGGAPTNIQGLSTGMGANQDELGQLLYDYGPAGQQLYDMLSKGLFNPQVADALINAMQPMGERGLNSVLGSFAGEGARFSSAAGIGAGDFESQFALNEQSTLANVFQQDQMAQLQLFNSILPTLNKEQDNSHNSGILSDILGGLEIAGGAALTVFSGGLGAIAGAGLISSGASNIISGNKPGGGSASSVSIPTPQYLNTSTPNTVGPANAGSNSPVDWMQALQATSLEGSGGSSITGDASSDDGLLQSIMNGGDAGYNIPIN